MALADAQVLLCEGGTRWTEGMGRGRAGDGRQERVVVRGIRCRSEDDVEDAQLLVALEVRRYAMQATVVAGLVVEPVAHLEHPKGGELLEAAVVPRMPV